jgi:DNA gyrase subunit A
METKEEDFVSIFVTANTHDDLLFFTDKGKAFQIKMYDLPEGRRATKGKSIVNFLSLSSDEKVTSVLVSSKEAKENSEFLVMVTKNGIIKKVDASSFKEVRRSGIIAIRLTRPARNASRSEAGGGDELKFSFLVSKGDYVILATKKGQSIMFKESDVRNMGRAAAGVRGIRLPSPPAGGDEVVGAGAVRRKDKEQFLLNMTKKGFGKKTPVKKYRLQRRGGSGIKTAKITDKTGPLMIAKVINPESEEIIAISQKGQVIRTALAQVPVLGRQTQGVRIMKLKAGDSIASLTCL